MYPADQVNVNRGERKILAGHDIIYFGPEK